jgi:hypothetical protein
LKGRSLVTPKCLGSPRDLESPPCGRLVRPVPGSRKKRSSSAVTQLYLSAPEENDTLALVEVSVNVVGGLSQGASLHEGAAAAGNARIADVGDCQRLAPVLGDMIGVQESRPYADGFWDTGLVVLASLARTWSASGCSRSS